jgi:hypothetical protein
VGFPDDEEAFLDYLFDARTGELRDQVQDRLLGFGNHMLVFASASIDTGLAGRGVGRWLTAVGAGRADGRPDRPP